MSLYLDADPRMFTGRSVSRADPGTRLDDLQGGGAPRKLMLSLTSRCNLRCAHCARSQLACPPGEDLAEPILDDVCRNLLPRLTAVHLGCADNGEPLLASGLVRFLEAAAEHPALDVELLTNGALLHRPPQELLARTLSVVTLSLEGVEGNYQRIRGVPYATFRRNLDLLLEARERYPRPRRMAVGFKITVLRSTAQDCFALVDLAARLGIDLLQVRDYLPARHPEVAESLLYRPREHREFYARLADHAARRGVLLSAQSAIPEGAAQRERPRAACSFPFEVLGVQADGRLLPCCVDRFDLGRYLPGVEGVRRAWTAPAFVELRKQVNGPRPPAACSGCETVNRNPLAFRPPRAHLLAKHLYWSSPASRSPRLQGLARAAWRRLVG